MSRIFLIGLALEGAMGLVGIALAALLGVDIPALFGGMAGGGAAGRAAAVAAGLLAAAPPLAAFFAALSSPWPPLARIRRTLSETLIPQLSGLGLPRVLMLAAAAGLGEELFFRGFLQPALTGPFGEVGALVAAAAVFGAVHWITPFYALYAGVLGLYLGGLFLATGGIIAPVVCHAAYDAVALGVYLRRTTEPRSAGPPRR